MRKTSENNVREHYLLPTQMNLRAKHIVSVCIWVLHCSQFFLLKMLRAFQVTWAACVLGALLQSSRLTYLYPNLTQAGKIWKRTAVLAQPEGGKQSTGLPSPRGSQQDAGCWLPWASLALCNLRANMAMPNHSTLFQRLSCSWNALCW